MKYVYYNGKTGEIIGFYTQEIHGTDIPKPNIQITDKEWQTCLNQQGYWKVDINTKKLVYSPPQEPSLNTLKEQLIQEIDIYNRNFIEQHYPTQKQLGFLQMSILLQQQLTDPNLTDTQKETIQQKLSRIQAVRDWIQNKCTALYYQLEQQIENAKTVEELNKIRNSYQQQYEQLNDTDPKVTFKELT